jgi:CheY-like chemotaxis protein
LVALTEMLSLRLPGIALKICEKPTSALEELHRNPYHAVIADIHMPEMSGLTLLESAGSLQPCPSFLLMTAAGDQQVAEAAFRLGAFDFIEKPFQRDEMAQSVRRAVETYNLRRRVVLWQERIVRCRRLQSIEHLSFAGIRLAHPVRPAVSDLDHLAHAFENNLESFRRNSEFALRRASALLHEAEAEARRRAWRRLQQIP